MPVKMEYPVIVPVYKFAIGGFCRPSTGK